MKYANWDEENVAENIKYFKKVKTYKKNAEEMANNLPSETSNNSKRQSSPSTSDTGISIVSSDRYVSPNTAQHVWVPQITERTD